MVILTAALGYGWVKRVDMREWAYDQSRDAGLVLRHIQVTGAVQTLQQDIDRVLSVDEGVPMASLDLDGMRRAVESLPWVQAVSMKRLYPTTLLIQVIERQPAALWQYQGQLALVDQGGHILTRQNLTAYQDYLLLVGGGAHQKMDEINSILDSQPLIKPHVRSAVYIGDRRWDIHFKNGMRLRLPEMGNSRAAIVAFGRFAALEKSHNLLAREIAMIDLRSDQVIIQLTPDGQKAISVQDLYSSALLTRVE